jgi:hypothetical protein
LVKRSAIISLIALSMHAGVQLMIFVMAVGSGESKQQKSNMAAKFILYK